MRWTCQTVAVFGLLAFFTFQVERSSASVLGVPVDSSAVDEPLTVEVTYEGGDLEDFLQENLDELMTLSEKSPESYEEFMKKINEAIFKEILEIEKLGNGEEAKKYAAAVRVRLAVVREAVSMIASTLGDHTVPGAAAGQLVKKIDQVIRLCSWKIAGSKIDRTDPAYLKRYQQKLEKLREASRKAIASVDQIPEGAEKRTTAMMIRAQLSKLRQEASTIITAVREGPIAKEASIIKRELLANIDKLTNIIVGKSLLDAQEEGIVDDSWTSAGSNIDRNDPAFVQQYTKRLDKLRKESHKAIASVNQIPQGIRRVPTAMILKARLSQLRHEATSILIAVQDGPIADEASTIMHELQANIDKVLDIIVGKSLFDAQEEGIVDDSWTSAGSNIDRNDPAFLQQYTKRLDKLREESRKAIASVNQILQGPKRVPTAMILKARLSQLRLEASSIMIAVQDGPIADEASTIMHELQAIIDKLLDIIVGKSLFDAQEEGIVDDSWKSAASNVDRNDPAFVQQYTKRLDKLRKESRKAIASVNQIPQGIRRVPTAMILKARLSQLRHEATSILIAVQDGPIADEASTIMDELQANIDKVLDIIVGKSLLDAQEEGIVDDSWKSAASNVDRNDPAFLQQYIRQRLDKLREESRKAIASVNQIPQGPKRVPTAMILKARLSQLRHEASSIIIAVQDGPIAKEASDIQRQLLASIDKVLDIIVGKSLLEVEEEEEIDDDSVFTPFGIVMRNIIERIDRLRDIIRRQVSKIDELNEQALERVKERVLLVYKEAKKIVEKFGKTAIGSAAKDLLDLAEGALKKIGDRIKASKDKISDKGTVTPKPNPITEKSQNEELNDDSGLSSIVKLLAEKAKERLVKIRKSAQEVLDQFGDSDLGNEAKLVIERSNAAIARIDQAIKKIEEEEAKLSAIA